MNQANLEMASLNNCNLEQAIITEAYVTGATSFIDANIDGADFTDTFLRKDQKKYLFTTAVIKSPLAGMRGVGKTLVAAVKAWAQKMKNKGAVVFIRLKVHGKATRSAATILENTQKQAELQKAVDDFH